MFWCFVTQRYARSASQFLYISKYDLFTLSILTPKAGTIFISNNASRGIKAMDFLPRLFEAFCIWQNWLLSLEEYVRPLWKVLVGKVHFKPVFGKSGCLTANKIGKRGCGPQEWKRCWIIPWIIILYMSQLPPFLLQIDFFVLFQDVHSRYRTEAHQDVVGRFNERYVIVSVKHLGCVPSISCWRNGIQNFGMMLQGMCKGALIFKVFWVLFLKCSLAIYAPHDQWFRYLWR